MAADKTLFSQASEDRSSLAFWEYRLSGVCILNGCFLVSDVLIMLFNNNIMLINNNVMIDFIEKIIESA